MNHDATTFSQALGGPDQVIGYDENGERQKSFAFGWNLALDRIYAMEMQAVGDSIVEELKIGPANHDFVFRNHGSMIGLYPHSHAAQEWVKEHLPDDAPWFGKTVMIERRYADDIIEGILNDGMKVI
jgi:hypothetical protein